MKLAEVNRPSSSAFPLPLVFYYNCASRRRIYANAVKCCFVEKLDLFDERIKKTDANAKWEMERHIYQLILLQETYAMEENLKLSIYTVYVYEWVQKYVEWSFLIIFTKPTICIFLYC